jgi:hypothetical protein
LPQGAFIDAVSGALSSTTGVVSWDLTAGAALTYDPQQAEDWAADIDEDIDLSLPNEGVTLVPMTNVGNGTWLLGITTVTSSPSPSPQPAPPPATPDPNEAEWQQEINSETAADFAAMSQAGDFTILNEYFPPDPIPLPPIIWPSPDPTGLPL